MKKTLKNKNNPNDLYIRTVIPDALSMNEDSFEERLDLELRWIKEDALKLYDKENK